MLEDLLDHLAPCGNRIRPCGVQGLANTRERPREAGRAGGSQGAHHADQFDGEVVADDLEHTHIGYPRRTGSRPSELDDAKHLRAEVDGNGDERLEGRHVLAADVMADACIQIVKRSGDRRVIRITGHERDAARPLLAQDVRRHTSAIGNERRNAGAHEAAAHAAQLESATLGEIDRRARGVERLGHTIQNGIEQRGHIVGTHRGHDHGQRA